MVEYRGSRAQSYIERDARVVSPSYTRGYPFVMDHGIGTQVWDVDGNRYLDFSSGVAVTSTGHSHPEVVKAIVDQAGRFLHMSGTDFYYPNQIELAEKLSDIAPMQGETRTFFANSGAEAIEAAIKLALYATGRSYFIAFYGGFHGRTLGALAFTASKLIQRRYFNPIAPPVVHIPYPDPYRPALARPGEDEGEAVIRFLEDIVFTRKVCPSEVAGILVEAIQGEGGYIVPPPSFFPALRRLCDAHGILLILDEVQSGVGRTGRWFAIEHEQVEPDIVAVAKGIASGMPLGAAIARSELMSWPAGSHASTFGGNPVSCAAALATLRLIENGMLDNAATVGEYLLSQLRDLAPDHPCVGDVRGRGLMIGLEVVTDRESKVRDPVLRNRIVNEAFKQGLLLLGAGPNTIRFVPPLNVTKAEVDEALAIFAAALTASEVV